MSRLLEAYARGRQSKAFDCPVTGVRLIMKQPVYQTRRMAETTALRHWDDRRIRDRVDVLERADLVRALTIGFSLYEETAIEPIGEAILELGEDALEAYDAVLKSIESPPAEDLSDAALDQLIDLFKKKDPQIAALLRLSEGSTAYSLLRSLVVRLPSSPTTSSSSNGSNSDTPAT